VLLGQVALVFVLGPVLVVVVVRVRVRSVQHGLQLGLFVVVLVLQRLELLRRIVQGVALLRHHGGGQLHVDQAQIGQRCVLLVHVLQDLVRGLQVVVHLV